MAMAGEDTPVEVIQHIQSFLTRKQAVRTSMISQQWYRAFSTNGVLYLDPHKLRLYRNQRRRGVAVAFQNFATKSLDRYKNLNLPLKELRLWMHIRKNNYHHEATTRLYDELILEALNLGVTVIDLNVVKTNSSEYYYTLLPQLFDSASLKELSLDGCRIDPATNQMRLICSRLVKLKLVHVEVGDHMLRDVLSGCHLIEDLTLHYCKGLFKVNLNLSAVRGNLKNFSARHDGKDEENYRTFLLVEFGAEADRYPNLISLELDGVRLRNNFDKDFSNRFPCLEKLRLKVRGRGSSNLGPGEANEIASDSVQSLSLNNKFEWNIGTTIIDAPKLRNFHVSCSGGIPSLIFRSSPDQSWKSYIEWNRDWTLNGSWMRELLTELSSSEISLVIDLRKLFGLQYEVQSISLPKVDNMTIIFGDPNSKSIWPRSSRCSEILCSLLFICNPLFITPTFKTTKGGKRYKSIVSKEACHVYRTLMKNVNLKRCNQLEHGVSCIHGLKEVEMEIYDHILGAWQRHPDPNRHGNPEFEEEKIRYRLKWN